MKSCIPAFQIHTLPSSMFVEIMNSLFEEIHTWVNILSINQFGSCSFCTEWETGGNWLRDLCRGTFREGNDLSIRLFGKISTRFVFNHPRDKDDSSSYSSIAISFSKKRFSEFKQSCVFTSPASLNLIGSK